MASRTASAPCPASAGRSWWRSVTVTRHAGQVEQDREPRRALHQGADGRTAQAEDEVPLPVARHRPIGRLRRALADQDLGGDTGFAPSAAARPRNGRDGRDGRSWRGWDRGSRRHYGERESRSRYWRWPWKRKRWSRWSGWRRDRRG